MALHLGDGRTRLFVREVCRGRDCDSESSRIGVVDVGPGATPEHTGAAWRPPTGYRDFDPLGMSLVLGDGPDDRALFVLDRAKPRVRIWRIPVTADDRLAPAAAGQLWFEDSGDALRGANDIQAVDEAVHVTRYDFLGFLPWRSEGWEGVVKIQRGRESMPYEDGLRGANGIIDLGPGRPLLVASYWERRLRYVSKTPGSRAEPVYATGPLPLYPDNLTLDGDRILIAGQRSYVLAAPNLLLPSLPSPSAVLEIGVGELGPEAGARSLWAGGRRHGRSVSVAAPVPGGLALGQIRTPDVLRVRCSGM